MRVEQKWIATLYQCRIVGGGSQRGEQTLRIRLQLTAVPLRIEEYLRETVATLGLELLRMLREEIAQLGLGRFGDRVRVFGYEL